MSQSITKESVSVAVHTTSDSMSQPDTTSQIWRPGALRRLPWMALGAVLLAAGGIAGCIVLLVISNNSPVAAWPYSPAVYLSITVTLVNLSLRYALSEAARIFWWRQTLKDSTTVGDLHRSWKHGTSFLSALLDYRHPSFIALATILMTVSHINAPLLQRASRVVSQDFENNVVVAFDAAKEIPFGWTGFVSGREVTPALLSSQFTSVFQQFSSASDIRINQSGCSGDCSGFKLNGVGFAVNCSSDTMHYDLSPADTTSPATIGAQVFSSQVQWSAGQPSTLNIGVQFKNADTCDGYIQIRNCTLNVATVDYPVILDGNSSSISLDSSTTILNDTVREISTFSDFLYPQSGPTTLGGFALALANQYNSAAELRFAGAVGYELTSSGSMATRQVNPLTVGNTSDCTLAFNDPMVEILGAARELMFRTAIAAANGTNQQTVRAFQTQNIPVYTSHWAYLAGACAVTFLAMVFVIPPFHGFWLLGRNMSMSPVEIGKAFGAQVLAGAGRNCDANEIVKLLDTKHVKYSIVDGQGMLIE